MNTTSRAAASVPRGARSSWLVSILVLAACSGGGGGGAPDKAPLNTDYSTLRLAESRDAGLVSPNNAEQVLLPLRNGLRMSIGGITGDDAVILTSVATPTTDGQERYSATTVQVEGVDEADQVKYDGRHMFIVRQEAVPPTSTVPGFEPTRNVLEVVRTDAANAGVETISVFTMEGPQSTRPLIYQMQAPSGEAEYIVAVTQNSLGWFLPLVRLDALVIEPDRTTVQLLDVRDPYHVEQAWEVQLDGWLKASRKIGDMLYLVSSYRPRLPDLVFPATTQADKESNERLVRDAKALDLLPRYSDNGGPDRALVSPDDCVIAADLASNEGYHDLTVITAVNLSERRIADVSCLSTNVNGVYASTNSLYIGGIGYERGQGQTLFTVLHKFELAEGGIAYRASGAVGGRIGWTNASYFMDEHQGDLRIVTSQGTASGNEIHQLSVLRETNGNLELLSLLPNSERPAPIGKPGETVRAVRFSGERAYVVTARVFDPLYVIDLSNPADPAIAGELEIPGFSTYLQPFGPPTAPLLLSIGQQTDSAGVRQGVKVELFDVRDISHPASLGVQIFGAAGSRSDVESDPHALTFMGVPGDAGRYRATLPIVVNETANHWTYSGVHLLEINGADSPSPQLRLQGVIKTDEPDGTRQYPRYNALSRTVLHDDSVFVALDESVIGTLWQSTGPL